MGGGQKPRAAVIIISYNDESHIERAIQSVCDQTEKQIEIICVNDGSTDSTYQRMLGKAEQDERIRVITKPSGGALSARFEGLKQVTSDYTMFLDSDDFLHPDAVKEACDAAERLGADVLEFGVRLVREENSSGAEDFAKWLEEEYFSQKKDIPEAAQGPELINASFVHCVMPWNIWGKLYQTQVLRKALQFYQGEWISLCEDKFLTLMVLCHATHYARIKRKLYEYTFGSGLTTTTIPISAPDAIKRVGTQWHILKLAREWLDRLEYPQDKISPAMTSFKQGVQNDVMHFLLVRIAPEKRGEYLSWLSKYCTEEEYRDLMCEAIRRQEEQIRQRDELIRQQQAQIEGQDEAIRQQQAQIEQQQAHNEQLEAQNRALSESFECISNSMSWRMTKPVRFALDTVKAVLHRSK